MLKITKPSHAQIDGVKAECQKPQMIIDILKSGYGGAQWLFEQWFWGYFFIPLYLSILCGTIGANLGAYRECQRRMFKEIRFISAKIFPPVAEKGSDVWASRRVDVALCYMEICDDMALKGFYVEANGFKALIKEISDAFDLADQEVWKIANRSADGNQDSLQRVTAYDAGMRSRMRRYLEKDHHRLVKAVLDQRPSWTAILDTPNFTKAGMRRLRRKVGDIPTRLLYCRNCFRKISGR